MANRQLHLDRRAVLAALGGAALTPLFTPPGQAQGIPGPARLDLKLRPASVALQNGATPVWSLDSANDGFISRLPRGGNLTLDFGNETPAPATLALRGINGGSLAEPLLAQPPLPANGKTSLTVPLKQAGTLLIDPRLTGDGGERPLLPRVLVVEDGISGVDRDEVLLIEDWRLRGDGAALTPGRDANAATTVCTLNRKSSFDINAKRNERMRLRIVNGCQRAVVAIKIADHDLLVMAFDGEAAEPFIARDGQIVLGPGTRADAFVDAKQPSGSTSNILLHDGTKAMPIGRILTNGEARPAALPAPAPLPPSGSPRVDLRTAQRFDLSLEPSQWSTATAFDKTSKPGLRVKRGQTAALAITNKMTTPATFHLHGHHFRLLDKMDDGWKPFWLDTLVFQPGQTQRIAFAAEFTGNFLMETMGNAWNTPRLVRWYSVE